MRHSVLLALLLSVSSLFAGEQDRSNAVDQTNAELSRVRAEATLIREELAQARAEKEEAFSSIKAEEEILKKNKTLIVSAVGQGVAPMNTTSPAQAYALAKRAAIADAYRSIAEKVKGVRIDGQDTIKNMMVQKSTIRTYVQAMVKNANIVETTFKEGLCEVEMEIMISHADFAQ
jgi:hypothetical protein